MRHDCRGSGSTQKIANAIKLAEENDTVVVETAAALELARRAQGRMRPGLELHCTVEPLPIHHEITCPDCKATMDDTPLEEWEYPLKCGCRAGWHHAPCKGSPGHGAGVVSK